MGTKYYSLDDSEHGNSTTYYSLDEFYKTRYEIWYEIARKDRAYGPIMLYVNKNTGEVKLGDSYYFKFKTYECDEVDKIITRRIIQPNDEMVSCLVRLFNKKAKELGVVIGSTHQKFEIENSREYYAPKTMEELFHTLIRYVQLNHTKKLYFIDLCNYITETVDKHRFCRVRRIQGPYMDFVLSVDRPRFRRDVDNKNRNTFDFIDIDMVIRSSDASKEKVKANKEEIFKKALSKLESSKSFQKYGVPINFLKMYQFVVHRDGSLTISFCIKELRENK